MRLKVGEKARIIGNTYGGMFKRGAIVIVASVLDYCDDVMVTAHPRTEDGWFITSQVYSRKDLVPARPYYNEEEI
jgi:hypothetical protein